MTLIEMRVEFTFRGGSGPSQGPLRSDVVSQGWNVAFMLTVSPLPGPLPLGPSALPHQLQVALSSAESVFSAPAVLPLIALLFTNTPSADELTMTPLLLS